tara:strand:+ start:2418 stop:3434 length:1017 start_codon:yes stop_codon:yes gene_type:complete
VIINFFLDNRVGGPHNYSKQFKKNSNKKFLDITSGKSKFCKSYITNLRKYWKFFFIFEIIVNFFEIIFLFNKNKYKCFYVFSIFNLAPVISGIILRKKITWFIVEEPSLITKIVFKILYALANFETIVIANYLAEKLQIKKYKIIYPHIDTEFWKNKSLKIHRGKFIKLLCVGNLNKTKNHLNLLKYLEKSKVPFELNIIGEALKTQKNYFNKIKNLKDKINNNTNNKITFLGRQKKNKIRKLLNESDLYILPSLSEGLSLSLIEAMSTSSLCLISNNSNNSKLILNKKNGFTFKLSNESFNKSLIEIINLDTKKKRLIKKHARETILKLNLKNNFHE